MKGFWNNCFLYDAFHFGVRQRIQKLVLHHILDVYWIIKFINKGLSIFKKLHVWRDALKVISTPQYPAGQGAGLGPHIGPRVVTLDRAPE